MTDVLMKNQLSLSLGPSTDVNVTTTFYVLIKAPLTNMPGTVTW